MRVILNLLKGLTSMPRVIGTDRLQNYGRSVRYCPVSNIVSTGMGTIARGTYSNRRVAWVWTLLHNS